MKQKEYRAAIDSVKFSEDFQERTIRRLERQNRKEFPAMKRSRTMLIAACLAAVLAVTAAAAIHFLSPKEVATLNGDEALADAFESEDAIVLDQTAECGEYTFRLAGMVSGANLSDFCNDVDESRTYLVASRARTDGTPIQEATITDYTVTPLVAGCRPWDVNIWTLGGGATGFVRDGVVYYIYDFESVEMFADRTVYLAVYEGGGAPSAQVFVQAEDGSISYNPDFTAPHAIFEVPLDPAKADPAAAEQFLADILNIE